MLNKMAVRRGLLSLALALAAASCRTLGPQSAPPLGDSARSDSDNPSFSAEVPRTLAWMSNGSSSEDLLGVARLILSSDDPDAIQLGIANISMIADMTPLARPELGLAATREERITLALDILEWTAQRFRGTPTAAEALHTATNLLMDCQRFDDVRKVAAKLVASYPDTEAATRARQRLWDLDTIQDGKPLSLGQWTDVGGKPVDLSAFKGKFVAIYCWYAACPGCKPEMRKISDAVASAPDRAVAIGLNFDKSLADCTASIIANQPPGKQIFMAAQPEGAQMKVFQFPRVIVIGPDGRVLARESSGDHLRKLLKETPQKDGANEKR
jgi:hypothetical protein